MTFLKWRNDLKYRIPTPDMNSPFDKVKPPAMLPEQEDMPLMATHPCASILWYPKMIRSEMIFGRCLIFNSSFLSYTKRK